MTLGAISRLRSTVDPDRFLDTWRAIKTAVVCRTRRFDISSEPHFDDTGSAYFREQLTRTRNYLEYGSGGSTVFASKRVQLLVSVDSDAHFLAAVRDRLAADDSVSGEHRSAVTKLMHVNIGPTVDWGMPAFTRLTARRVRRWQAYPSAPWRYLQSIGQQPDLILIDGRFRVACVLESLLNLSPVSEAQILVDDYITRPHYHVIERFAEVEMAGRMAVVRPGLRDRSEALSVLQEYWADYR